MRNKSKVGLFFEKVRYGELLPENLRGKVLFYLIMTSLFLPLSLVWLLFPTFLFMAIPFAPFAILMFFNGLHAWREAGNKAWIFIIIVLIVTVALLPLLMIVVGLLNVQNIFQQMAA